MPFFQKFIAGVKKYTAIVVDWLSIALLAVIFILGVAQIFWRWILRNPIVWSEELIQLIYVWICYLGWIIAERRDTHIRITAVSNRLPVKVQKWLQAFNHILCILFSVLMVIYGYKLFKMGLKRTAVSMKWLNFGWVYAIGPICNFAIIFYEISVLIECLTKGPRDYRDIGSGKE